MEWIEGVYFFYMFISLFFLNLSLLLYFHNRKKISYVPDLKESPSLSILIPAYNEETTIATTIEHIFQSDYKGLKEVIAVNDGSKDDTLKVLQKLKKKYPKLVVFSKPNSGKANTVNYALQRVRGDFVAIIDADSYPDKKAFSQMMGYFSDKQVGVVTATCTPFNRNTFLERLQVIEYKVIAFTRKLLEFIDSIYVAPGSLSVYRAAALRRIGGFDATNMTEDIESTWHMLREGWKVRMCFTAHVKTVVPNKFKAWWIQRVRWTIGGFQVLKKYAKCMFRHGMFGYFVIPFFAFGLTIGLAGLAIFLYLLFARITRQIEIALYKIGSDVSLVSINGMNVTPTVLNYFGVILFIMFLAFTFFVLFTMKEKILRREKLLEIIIYMTLYLVVYPFMITWSIYKWIKGERRWR